MSAATRNTKWWVGKINSPETGKPLTTRFAGPFTTREDALAARQGMEKLYGTYAVFKELCPEGGPS